MYQYSGIKRLALFDRIYKKFPSTKYFLDFKSPENLGAEKDQPITDEEKEQLKGAIDELYKACSNIIADLEYTKGEKLSAEDLLNARQQMSESWDNLKEEFKTLKSNLSKTDLSLTKLEVMRAFDNVNSSLKAFLSRGEQEIFKARQKERLMNKTITLFKCRTQCTARKCKDIKSYNQCKAKCPAYQIGSCLKAGDQAVAALNH
jgi:hypothetical protein